jgi:hypothetical protein
MTVPARQIVAAFASGLRIALEPQRTAGTDAQAANMMMRFVVGSKRGLGGQAINQRVFDELTIDRIA